MLIFEIKVDRLVWITHCSSKGKIFETPGLCNGPRSYGRWIMSVCAEIVRGEGCWCWCIGGLLWGVVSVNGQRGQVADSLGRRTLRPLGEAVINLPGRTLFSPATTRPHTQTTHTRGPRTLTKRRRRAAIKTPASGSRVRRKAQLIHMFSGNQSLWIAGDSERKKQKFKAR